MKLFLQDVSGLIGSREDIQLIEEKESARILVISDSHNNSFAFESALRAKGKDCDMLVFCGDGLYDLVNIIQKSYTEQDLMDCIPSVIAFAQGNNDASVYPLRNPLYTGNKDQSMFAKLQASSDLSFKICGHKALVTHGHFHQVYSGNEKLLELAALDNTELIFYGHTHYAESVLNYPKILTLNPGSISRPRGGQPSCFATVEVKKSDTDFMTTIWQLNGKDNKTVPYNI